MGCCNMPYSKTIAQEAALIYKPMLPFMYPLHNELKFEIDFSYATVRGLGWAQATNCQIFLKFKTHTSHTLSFRALNALDFELQLSKVPRGSNLAGGVVATPLVLKISTP